MGRTDYPGPGSENALTILSLLEALRNSDTGDLIYRQIELLLNDMIDRQQVVEHACISLVNRLLEAYVEQVPGNSPLIARVRVMQTRLQPPLSQTDQLILKEFVALHAAQITSLEKPDPVLFQNAISPLLEAFGMQAKVDTTEQMTRSTQEPDLSLPEKSAARDATSSTMELRGAADEPALAGDNSDVHETARFSASEETGEAFQSTRQRQTGTGTPIGNDDGLVDDDDAAIDEESQVDQAYRQQLDMKRKDIQKLQNNLARQVLETITQNEEFGVLLEVVLGELRQAGDARELEDLRWTLIREIEKLTRGHHELADKLDSTHHYLQLVESDSRQLTDELTRVRLLSLTDELTGLPNRRAFLRRIEDEVARVQRYGFPLSLALIDLDHFKQVNDKYGHGGGDEVLQLYSKNILSIFRHHDLVARYGGEEFAVLLPNTEAEGALRALTKVRNRALETRWQPNGEVIPVPTFSAGVSLYKPGEVASAFIERADKALYRAKKMGRNRVEIDATYQSDAEIGMVESAPPVEKSRES